MANIIDCRGLACPQPVIKAKKGIEALSSGEITLVVDNETAKENLQKLAMSMGLTYKAEVVEGFYYVTIEKTGSNKTIAHDEKNLIILISTDKLGSGDDKLGTALMKSYMFALSESDVIPKTMLFINSGVKLTSEGSEVMESIKKLADRGVEILSCGTCLDFYNLNKKLLIGTVTNMYTIVEKMNNAVNTIKL